MSCKREYHGKKFYTSKRGKPGRPSNKLKYGEMMNLVRIEKMSDENLEAMNLMMKKDSK